MIMSSVVLGACLGGFEMPESVLSFLQVIIISMITPVLGYYGSSSYEAVRTHPDIEQHGKDGEIL